MIPIEPLRGIHHPMLSAANEPNQVYGQKVIYYTLDNGEQRGSTGAEGTQLDYPPPTRCGCMNGRRRRRQCREQAIGWTNPPRCNDCVSLYHGVCACDCFGCIERGDRHLVPEILSPAVYQGARDEQAVPLHAPAIVAAVAGPAPAAGAADAGGATVEEETDDKRCQCGVTALPCLQPFERLRMRMPDLLRHAGSRDARGHRGGARSAV